MIVLAHVLMLPVEEVLLPLASSAGAGTVMWLGWMIKRAHSYRK
jgi:hypothetical protein